MEEPSIAITESESSNLNADKLSNSNFHAWKQKIQLTLAFRDLDEVIEDDMPESDDPRVNA